jgi:hypothetical protein
VSVWENALELASRITHPYSVAAFAVVIAAILLLAALKAEKARIAWLLGGAILVFGVSPLIASTFLSSRGIYHIRIVVLGTDGQPVNQADVTASSGGEWKQASGNWEFDLPPQVRPSDSTIRFFASVRDAYLSGSSTLKLDKDYYPTTTIQLVPLAPQTVRGVVVDESGRSIAGASVSVSGYPDISTTDQMGNFSLPSYHAEGQLVTVRAEKGELAAQMSVIAGRDAEIVLRKR